MNLIKVSRLLLIAPLFFTSSSQAVQACSGKITQLNNYNTDEKLHFLMEGTTHYLTVNTKTAISMVLSAFVSGKKVKIYMNEPEVTKCSGGPGESWGNGAPVSGWIHVDQ
ncbi:MAG: hypothetical protein ACFHVJ_06700 [Aestuariibacter sp.]